MHVCPEGQWRCNDGQCVAPISRCDGRIQCRDKSDEVGCHYNTTPRKFLLLVLTGLNCAINY